MHCILRPSPSSILMSKKCSIWTVGSPLVWMVVASVVMMVMSKAAFLLEFSMVSRGKDYDFYKVF